MSSVFALRTPHRFPFSLPIPFPHRFLPTKPYLFSALSSNLALTLTLDPSLSIGHGPSLRRGRRAPPPPADEGGAAAIDRPSFSRAFDVAALRVPAAECSALEARLRGHLLNWPRVRNVARVPGDDVEPELRRMLSGAAEGDGGARLDSLARRSQDGSHGGGCGAEEPLASSPVLYREKLVKEFNCRGFLRFRNLAKISRPKKKNKKEKERKNGEGRKERVGKNEYSVIEVISDGGGGGGGDGDEEEDMRGLLGDEFRGGRWRGPTRLLLLDERHANKGAEELPEAVKVASLLLCELPFV